MGTINGILMGVYAVVIDEPSMFPCQIVRIFKTGFINACTHM